MTPFVSETLHNIRYATLCINRGFAGRVAKPAPVPNNNGLAWIARNQCGLQQDRSSWLPISDKINKHAFSEKPGARGDYGGNFFLYLLKNMGIWVSL